MRIFFTTFLVLLLSISGSVFSQTRTSFKAKKQPEKTPQPQLDKYQLDSYRENLWNAFPFPDDAVNDFEGIFSREEEQKLDSLIKNVERVKEVEILLVTMDTNMVSKEKFNEFAIHLLNVWQVGKKVKNNGILICISSGYRQMRISNNFGIERILNDDETQELINKNFIPSFKREKYFKGTYTGLNALISKIYSRLYLNVVQN